MKMKYPFMAMGCSCEIIVRNTGSFAAKSAVEIALNEIKRLEKKYSFFDKTSYLSAINDNAYGNWVELDEETVMLLNKVDEIYISSNELYDPTIGCIAPLWDFRNMNIPDETVLREKLKAVGWAEQVELKDTRCRFHHPETTVDFGGLVKEYALGRAFDILTKINPQGGLVNLGGDIACYTSESENKKFWRIGISNPRDYKQSAGSIKLKNGVVLTSGDYHRFFIRDGVRYHHLLNPKTGYPFELNYSGVTFISQESALHTTQALMSFYYNNGSREHIPQTIQYHALFDQNGKPADCNLPEDSEPIA